jgi:GNAT superfamily N-acetyltransferase
MSEAQSNLQSARVRKATPADLPRLLELLAQLREAPAATAGVTEAERRALDNVVADTRQQLAVIEVDERIVGTAVLVVVPNVTHGGQPYAIIENVVVDERERGRGYGEQLIAWLVDEARRAGCYKVALTSNKRRTDAHRFYARIGFRATHEGFRIDL